MWIVPAESRSVRGTPHQPIFMGDRLFVTRICPVCPGNGSLPKGHATLGDGQMVTEGSVNRVGIG